MVIKNVNLETVCGITSTLPENQHPEVAFSGKSNVGKSSLINGLMNRKAYARVSQQPGKTQTINYYNVNDEIYIVDLPGYGFANVSQAVKAKWGKMIENYLRKSRQLRMVFLLVDIRHEPSANDKHMYSWIIENGFYRYKAGQDQAKPDSETAEADPGRAECSRRNADCSVFCGDKAGTR